MSRKTLTRTESPRFPEHPLEEHQWRLSRARKIMRDDKLDVLLLARNFNVFYMTGSRFVFVGKDGPVALAPQSTAVITKDADIYCQRFGAFDTDSVPMHTTVSAQLELFDDEMELVNIFKDYGIGRGARIGTEWGPGLCLGINPIKFLRLKQQLEEELGAEVVDATPTIWKMTGIKSRLEIERMKVACGAAARAMTRILDEVQVGINALDVARKVATYMMQEGADAINHNQVMADAAGMRFGSCSALDKPVESGVLRFDIGARYKRYASDIARQVILGRQPTRDELKVYEVRRGADEVLDRAIKPGVSMDSALMELKKYVEDNGCVLKEHRGSINAGHEIGMEPYHHPNLVPSWAQPEFQNKDGVVLFQSGMMFTYEMAIRLPDPESNVMFNVEDDVVVTETGVENMTGMLSRDLCVKP